MSNIKTSAQHLTILDNLLKFRPILYYYNLDIGLQRYCDAADFVGCFPCCNEGERTLPIDS
ncbi:MAG: hypothetical protein ACKPBT_01760 [Microcystis aeruginosa]